MARAKTTAPAIPAFEMELMNAANVWLIREQEGRADAAEFAAWLDAAPAHAEAYRRAQAVYGALETPAAAGVKRRRSVSRRQAAAAVLLLAGTAWLALHVPDRAMTVATDVGETRAITLPDGSHLELNADSEARIDYTASRRGITLERGEASFDVVHDVQRPFVVHAAGAKVTVVGTRFNVKLDDTSVAVGVAEGRVELRDGRRRTLLTPGRAAFVAADRLEVSDIPVSRVSEWRTGWVAFEQTTLSSVVHELSRYHPGTLLLFSREAGNRPISARLDIRSPEQALKIAVAAASAKMVELPGGLRIIF